MNQSEYIINKNMPMPPAWIKRRHDGEEVAVVAMVYRFDTEDQLREFIDEKGDRLYPVGYLDVTGDKICLRAHILDEGEEWVMNP